MDFDLSDTQSMVRDTARAFAARSLAPRARAIEDGGTIPPEIIKEMAELGLLGVNLPGDLGGAEAGVVAYSLAMTEVARGCASTAVTMAVTNMVGEVLNRFGTPAQRERYLPRLTSGEYLAGAFALSEPGAGSDPGAMTTTATREGDKWVLRGAKQWITSGDFAGVMVVWARTGGGGTAGLSAFAVEGGTPGLKVGRHEDKMGLRGSTTVPLTFDDCEVPLDALLGDLGGGFRIAMMALDGGRIGIASQALGIAEGALSDAVSYAKDRQQFGRPIAEFQAIQWMLADSRAELDAARLLTLRAASMKERQEPFSREAAMAKLFASEAAWKVVNRAVQVHGGYGYTREFPVERRFRDARVTRIYEGTSEVQRLVIARALLR
ncbi:MAG: acyl-CoA dehydrogenase family protein [Deltaproteobacteria bacterium]|nr:acyl-CoA dehydrogenase family protein [Deltaproteobacteria bacterium]